MENIDKNIQDFRKDTLEVERFLTGTRVSYNFFKENYPIILKEFSEKNRTSEETEGMELFKNLKESISKYETDIYTFCFINLIARTEAFLNDILETLYLWKSDELTDENRKKSILKFSHLSFKDKMKFLKNKFNLNFPQIEEHNQKIIELFSTRNLILHNNGLVNETYLKINESSKLKLGDKRVINEDYLNLTFVLLIIIAKSIEEQIKDKKNNDAIS